MRRVLFGASMLVLGLAFTVPSMQVAHGSAPRCFGKKATIVGTQRDDRIKGTDRDDVILALGGKDAVNGRGGNDRICRGQGFDGLSGGRATIRWMVVTLQTSSSTDPATIP